MSKKPSVLLFGLGQAENYHLCTYGLHAVSTLTHDDGRKYVELI